MYLLNSSADEIADLNDRHIGLQQTRDNEREDFKRQLQEARSEYQDMKVRGRREREGEEKERNEKNKKIRKDFSGIMGW